ncbi:SANT and BTB domain regulator of class switch recombination isoform X1 [Macrobrachium rosenbergii]|uniref:SANT and BTB domain regulator of class switch recombination isoform X1 n=1 Tax=Macrobrachium rosenbergii TaxID=79674 RepID=UPI0034D702C4
MVADNASSPGASSSSPGTPTTTSNATFSNSSATSGTLKNGIGMAWAVSGNGPKSSGSVTSGCSLPMNMSTVTMGNVLDFLFTAAQLHRVAAATTEKVRAGGHLVNGTGSSDSDSHGGRTPSSGTPSTSTAAAAAAALLPSASQTWAKLLGNPAAAAQEQTLALLQMALQDGLLDSILPYMVSSLNIGLTTSLTPSQSITSGSTMNTLAGGSAGAVAGGGGRSRTPTPTNKGPNSTKSSVVSSSGIPKSPTRDVLTKEVPKRSPTPTPAPPTISSVSQHTPPSAPASPSNNTAVIQSSSSVTTANSSSLSSSANHNNTLPSSYMPSATLPRPNKEDVRPTPPVSLPIRGMPDKSPGIIIHVCDEARGLRQDFTCPRDLLIHHIGYFADVTAGQRLEDVDISVHCDVSIFEWLLRWVKKGLTEDHHPPTLEPKTAVSILISADFLKMTPLVEEVLQYVHDNINLILEAQVNLNCLSDTILTRLSRLFTHWELENLRDRRDRIQNKLYARFLQTLCDNTPAPLRGIFKTASTLYRCTDCGQLVSRAVERFITCVPSNTIVTTTGQVFYTHSRDSTWSLTEHVRQLKTDLKTWRLVYWRLWGQVHFLPCSTCGSVFPASELKLCRHHRLDASSSCDLDVLLSTDSFPCCGARALRFSPLPVRNGCQVTDHTVQLTQSEEETWGPIPLIYDDLLTFQILVCVDPPRTMDVEQKNVLWSGVPLVPPSKGERSLLDRSWQAHFLYGERDGLPNNRQGANETSTTTTTAAATVSAIGTGTSSESSSDEEEGGGRPGLTSRMRANLMKRANRARRTLACEVMAEPSWRWDAGRSTRHNQDAQRDREGRLLRDLTSWLTLTAPETGHHKGHKGKPDRRRETAIGPDAGCYYRLEAEFRERHGGHSHGHTHSGGGGGTFRAKVQAISRIKMRLRHRAAFSASR